jgi:cytochrome c-type biogenesis protein CcmE
MNKLFFVPSTKINARIAETVITGQHINIAGLTYQMVSKRPQGRRVLRKLQNLDTNTQITIYA